MVVMEVHVRPVSPSQVVEPLRLLLTEADDEFIPPLSARTSTVQRELRPDGPRSEGISRYLDEMMRQELLCAQIGESVVGLVSYRTGHTITVGRESMGPLAYVTTVVVAPSARGRGVARALYTSLIAQAGDGSIATRTWSTNDSHIALLRSLGFVEALRLPDDRGPDLDTVYYLLEPGSAR